MAVNLTNLFTTLGHGFFVQKTLNTARLTTVPNTVKTFLDSFNSLSLPLKKAATPVEGSNRGWQSSGSGLASSIRQSNTDYLIEMFQADANLDRKDLTTALQTLIRQMVTDGASVDANEPTASAGAIVGTGDGVLVVSAKRADGKTQENLLPETIRITCTGDTTPSQASFTAKGDVAVADKLSQDWPLGSGCSRGITATDADSSLLDNGDFDDWTQSNVPDYWTPSVGTVGTTLKSTSYEVQTLTVTGPPTAGTYIINWTDPNSKARATTALAYNATAADVQAAMRLFPGLEDLTVTASGTTPNWTHTITFVGQAGNLSQITITNNTTGGTYTPATSTAGSANAFIGKAVEFDSDGAQLTTLNQPVTLKALTQYAFNLWMLADVVPAAGVITVDLVDGIGGTVVADEAGTSNSFTITCSALTTSFVAKNGVFRTPKIMPAAIYLRIRISTAVTAGTSIYFDHAALVEMTELYKGGPSAAIFSGKTPMRKSSTDGQVEADYFVLTAVNAQAGEIQTWFDRNFNMREKGLLLPSNAAGSETIADSLVA
jgi:hypothetical protein